ncbi:MAG: hypothetical protein U0992_00530 [Planctomycetaceae bacterium]
MAYVAYRWMLRSLSILSPIEVAAALDDAGSSGPPRCESPPKSPASSNCRPAPRSPPMHPPLLIERAVRRSYEALQPVDFRSGLNRRHLAWCLVGLAMALAVPAAFGMAYPGVARLWAERWFAGSDRPWPRDTQLEVVGVENGKLIVPRGEPVSLQVRVTDAAQPTETVWLRVRTESGSDDTPHPHARFAPGDFRYELPPVQVPYDAPCLGRRRPHRPVPDRPGRSPQNRRPRTSFAKCPRSGSRSPYTFYRLRRQRVRLSPRTTAALTVETNVPVARIESSAVTGAPAGLQPIDATHFRAEWTHNEPVQACLTLHGRDIAFASHQRGVSIGLLPDRPPASASATRLRVTPSATIPLAITARDDFDIKKIDLAIRIAEGIDSKEQGDNAPKPDSESETKKDAAATEPAKRATTTTPTDERASTPTGRPERRSLTSRPPKSSPRSRAPSTNNPKPASPPASITTSNSNFRRAISPPAAQSSSARPRPMTASPASRPPRRGNS